jgi:hypothetical protein
VSLRKGLIEAAAGRLEDNGNHGADWWEMNCHEVSEFVLDEVLDYLSDERIELCYQLDLDYATVERLIAALRIQENQP